MATELDCSGINLKHQKRSRRPKSGALKFDTKGARYLIVELPSSRVMTILVLSLLLACIIVSFPWSRSVLHRSMSSYRSVFDDPVNPEIVPVLFNDLANEGLLRTGNKALFLTEGDDAVAGLSSSVLRDIEMDLIHVKDLDHQSSIQQQSFEFVFTYGYEAASGFIDRALKTDGVLAVQLSQGPSEMFEVPNNYRIVYFRKFEFPIIAMKRLGGEQAGAGNVNGASAGQRRLMGMSASEEEKKAALRNLEDVLLEPPRAASRRSSRYSKKTKYLPDLMGDRLALDKYTRRVFIDIATSEKDPRRGSGTEWFLKNYPTRNLHFEMHTVETVGEEDDDQGVAVAQGQAEAAKDEGGMAEWLQANVKEEEEYVVMKAEAEVVEELVTSRAIRLVDELFLDCKPRGRSRRAYWECLALYGRLRDEGVAVHQWWG